MQNKIKNHISRRDCHPTKDYLKLLSFQIFDIFFLLKIFLFYSRQILLLNLFLPRIMHNIRYSFSTERNFRQKNFPSYAHMARFILVERIEKNLEKIQFFPSCDFPISLPRQRFSFMGLTEFSFWFGTMSHLS